MAVVVRRRTRALVNPPHRRLTLAQRLAGFGGKRSQSAAFRARPNRGGLRKITRRAIARGGKGWGAFHRLHPSHSEQLYRKLKSSHERMKRRTNAGPFSRRKTKKRLKSWAARMRSRGIAIPRSFASKTVKKYTRKNSAHRTRTRRARRNVSAIVTAGLPFLNPASRPKKRRKQTMAMSHKTRRRRRSTAHHSRRRRAMRMNRRHRMRTNPVRRHHHRRRPYYAHRRNPRRNLSRGGRGGITGLVTKAAYVGGGIFLPRALTQAILGSQNVSWVGYGGNAIATLLLGWGAGRFFGSEARNMFVIGGALGILVRMLTDLTPWGQTLSLSGFGDPGISGLGAYFTSSYVDPRIYTGQGAELRVPPAWQSQVMVPAAAGAVRTRGTGWATGSTYAPQGSTYRRAA